MIKKMKHRNGLVIMLMIMSVFGCKPDPLEYARPDDLAGTIYTQLESMGTFSNYLKLLDLTQYKEPLTKGGSWTIFAPTDDAFSQYMDEKGYASIEDIPEEKVLELIQMSIITDGWNTTTLTYFKNRFYEGQSFRRRTQYSLPNKEFDTDTMPHMFEWDEDPAKYLVKYSNGRQKTVTYFLDSYMENWGVTYDDFEFMFPGETFTSGDMKVYGTHVSQQNIVAENGMIYALDKVLDAERTLFDNMYRPEYNGKYSMFQEMLERYSYLHLIGDEENPDTGEIETLYQWRFNTGLENNYLPFNPFDENYATNIDGTLAQSWGLLIPTNEALTSYLEGNSILGQFYDSYDDMSLSVLGKFLSPFFVNDFWDLLPSRFGQTYDTGIKLVDYKPEDIVDKRLCSNGLFVGVNTVYTNSSFGTIMGPLLLDPDYSIMLQAVQDLGIDTALESKSVRFTILGVKNDQYIDVADPNSPTRRITVLDDISTDEITYIEVTGDTGNGNRIYPDPDATTPSSSDLTYVQQTLNAIVLNQIVYDDVDFNSNNYYQAQSGQFIHVFNGNSAAGGEDIRLGNSVQTENTIETANGYFYEMSGIVNPPFLFTYGALAAVDDSRFSSFVQVMESADALIEIIGSEDKLINFLNLNRSFSLFVPNNTAVNQAIADGVIVDPYNMPTDPLELAQAKLGLLNFAKLHFMQQAMATDGKTSGVFSSMYFSKIVDFAPVYEQFAFANTTTSITVTNEDSGDAVPTSGITNLFSRGVVIHEIGNYLK